MDEIDDDFDDIILVDEMEDFKEIETLTYDDYEETTCETEGFLNCVEFIERLIDQGSYYLNDKSYCHNLNNLYQNEKENMKLNFLDDFTNGTQNFNYDFSFEPLFFSLIQYLDDSNENVLQLLKILTLSPTMVQEIVNHQAKNRPDIILSILDLPHLRQFCEFSFTQIKKAFIFSHKQQTQYVSHYKNLLASLIESNLINIKEKNIEEELINFHKDTFGITGINEFLEDAGFKNSPNFFGAQLSSFQLNVKACERTYLSSSIFAAVTHCIQMYDLNFPKSYCFNRDNEYYIISVQNHLPYAIEKTQALIEELALMPFNTWTDNHYERLKGVIEKVNLDFTLMMSQKEGKILKI